MSSLSAYAWAILILGLIVVECIALVLESLPSLCCGRYDHVWGPIEIVCIAFFTVEYVLRCASCPWYFPLDNPPDEQTTGMSSSYHDEEPPGADAIHFRTGLRILIRQHRILLFRQLKQRFEDKSGDIVHAFLQSLADIRPDCSLILNERCGSGGEDNRQRRVSTGLLRDRKSDANLNFTSSTPLKADTTETDNRVRLSTASGYADTTLALT